MGRWETHAGSAKAARRRDKAEDQPVLRVIQQPAEEEHRLYEHEALTDADRARLARINIELDQCWDLLRQRQALRTAGRDPNEARVRPPEANVGGIGPSLPIVFSWTCAASAVYTHLDVERNRVSRLARKTGVPYPASGTYSSHITSMGAWPCPLRTPPRALNRIASRFPRDRREQDFEQDASPWPG
jgi:hypothetical protein